MAEVAVTWVVPCYNEAARLEWAQVEALTAAPGVHVLFVDDGSTDATLALLEDFAARLGPDRATVHAMPVNGGKAEAVRQGLLAALEAGSRMVGYLDADFATPPSEAHRLHTRLEGAAGAKVVMGSRVRRLGADIDRHPLRHYLGRVFSTAASLALDLPVYDTQCGAKLFRDHHALRTALQSPFSTRWAFDVELIGRLLDHGLVQADFVEVPLLVWHDVGGSKLTRRAMFSAAVDLAIIGKRRLRR